MSGSVIYFCHSDHNVNTPVTSRRVKNLTNDVHSRTKTDVRTSMQNVFNECPS